MLPARRTVLRKQEGGAYEPGRAGIGREVPRPRAASLPSVLHAGRRSESRGAANAGIDPRRGELGYVLTHAFGAVFDNPDLIAVAVIGDGEAETAPLEGSLKGTRFLNAARDGAVLTVLHLNGYKIAGPTELGRAEDETVRSLLEGHGYAVHFVSGDKPMAVHRALATTLDACVTTIRSIQDGPGREAFGALPVGR